jgi:signal transduction histidine kinase
VTLDTDVFPTEAYAAALADYAHTHSEAALYQASLLSQAFVKQGVGPEEIIALHGEAFDAVCMGCSDRDKVRLGGDALQFLLEVMIAYGVQHAEYADLKAREAEASVTAAQRQIEEAREAEQRKAELLAVVAHELRTPITAALGTVQLARRSLTRGHIEGIPRLLDSTEKTLQRLSRLTGDLVEASRGGSPEIHRKPLELAVIVSQACTWAATVAENKGVQLVRQSDAWSARVLGDEDALLTVFGNLLANAIRYTPAGGSVTVRFGTDSEEAWVEVADTGIGMSPEIQPQVFEQFFRAPDAQRIEQQGLGLGLFLVQRLIQAHGGRVDLASTLGVGSSFKVSLPLLTADAPQPQEEPDERAT